MASVFGAMKRVTGLLGSAKEETVTQEAPVIERRVNKDKELQDKIYHLCLEKNPALAERYLLILRTAGDYLPIFNSYWKENLEPLAAEENIEKLLSSYIAEMEAVIDTRIDEGKDLVPPDLSETRLAIFSKTLRPWYSFIARHDYPFSYRGLYRRAIDAFNDGITAQEMHDFAKKRKDALDAIFQSDTLSVLDPSDITLWINNAEAQLMPTEQNYQNNQPAEILRMIMNFNDRLDDLLVITFLFLQVIQTIPDNYAAPTFQLRELFKFCAKNALLNFPKDRLSYRTLEKDKIALDYPLAQELSELDEMALRKRLLSYIQNGR